jgi:ribosomal protein S18 acetylase RimI-like enzyme
MTSPANNAQIRVVRDNDADCLSKFAKLVFAETYGHALAPESLANYLQIEFSPLKIRSHFENSVHRVLDAEDEIVGWGALNETIAPSCVLQTRAVELSRFYIHADHRGSGASDALLAQLETDAISRDYQTLWLCVWRENARAIAFYRRRGFEIVGQKEVWVEDVLFNDWVMVKHFDKR